MNILGAPTNLGLKPYDEDGTARGTNLAPARLREHGLVTRLGGRDLGDVAAAPYRDFVRRPGTVRNEDLVLDHVRAIASVIASTAEFTVVAGGDCSILLGNLLGHRRRSAERMGEIGVVYIDGHHDFNTPTSSETGGAAGMDLALATGRGDTPLARLNGAGPLVRDEHVVTFGIRDVASTGNFRGTGIRNADSPEHALEMLDDRPFFIHLDVDALDPAFMPFVDEPVAGGLDPQSLSALLAKLVHHPRALGMEVTIYDPKQDPDGDGAALIVDVLESAFER